MSIEAGDSILLQPRGYDASRELHARVIATGLQAAEAYLNLTPEERLNARQPEHDPDYVNASLAYDAIQGRFMDGDPIE